MGRWIRLRPDTIAALPEAPGIFEVANLVRTVLYIASAEGSLREQIAGLARQQEKLPAAPGGYFFRYQLTPEAAALLEGRLTDYRAAHRNQLPPGNRSRVHTIPLRRCAA